MATLTRVRRTQLDISPNQFAAAPPSGLCHLLVGYNISNYNNTSDSWIGFYNNTSGVVTVGTTETDYGRILVPSQSQLSERSGTITNPLFSFSNGITAFAATTETGVISPTSDLTMEIFYYTV